MRRRTLTFALLAALLGGQCLLLAGCGKKGALYLPDAAKPVPAEQARP